ncbi:MAG: hypothetical protein M3Q27_02895, partial [Actinomycetota bacterium]|nr:hypothetical protein [Actinomycetota bacterium]
AVLASPSVGVPVGALLGMAAGAAAAVGAVTSGAAPGTRADRWALTGSVPVALGAAAAYTVGRIVVG